MQGKRMFSPKKSESFYADAGIFLLTGLRETKISGMPEEMQVGLALYDKNCYNVKNRSGHRASFPENGGTECRFYMFWRGFVSRS